MKALKTVALILAIFFGGLFLIAFLIGFVDGIVEYLNEDEQQTSKVETKVAPPIKDDSQVTLESDQYETVLSGAKDIFVDGCTGEGTTRTQCVCMYDWLDNNLTNAEFGVVITEAGQGKIPDNIWSAAKACVTI